MSWLRRVFFVAFVLAPALCWSAVTVDGVAIPVSDMDRAVAFYHNVLGFERVADREVAGADYEHLFGVFGARIRAVRMRLGEEHVELTEFVAPRGRPMPPDSKGNDGWFQHVAIVVGDMDRAYMHLRSHKVRHASTGPQRLPAGNPHAGGIEAFYFRDSEGNFLEVLAFPPDKGAAKWHRQSSSLFLGIDHTAIVVADSDSSLAFYRDALGLQVAGTSENWGEEQERLNNVFGARLRITGLRGEGGIGVELLEYLSPRSGRSYPVDSAANDLWHWQIQLAAADIESLEAQLRKTDVTWVSNATASVANAELGYDRAFMVRDPDGHANLIKQNAHRGDR